VQDIIVIRIFEESFYLALHVSVSIWHSVSEPDFIFQIFELIFEAERIVILNSFAMTIIIL